MVSLGNQLKLKRNKKNSLKFYIITSMLSWFPFAMIFSFAGIDEPYLLIYFIKCTRLMKIWPLRRLSNYWKKYYLKITRIVEMLLIYYIFAHIIAWSLIWIAYEVPDIRTTWMKRLPSPQATGVRAYADKTGLSNLSIYWHAFNFTINTLSHVATGEVSMVTYQERIYCAFLIWFATFMYAFLFGNIASIVSDLSPQKMYFKFYTRYEIAIISLKVDVVPKKLMQNIKDYFDFEWSNSHGIPASSLLNRLPSWISTDILTSRYSNAIDNLIILRNIDNKIDVPFTNSVFRSIIFRTYMDEEFIVIGGSYSRNTYIMLEGEAGIFSFHDDFISFMRTGSHYSNDLDSDDEDTFQYKRPVHIISKGTSIVGVLTLDMLNELYLAYPDFKDIMRSSNRYFNLYAKKYLRKYLKSKRVEYNSHNAIHEMAIHYAYSSSAVYDSLRSQLSKINLSSDSISDFNIRNKQAEGFSEIISIKRSVRFEERKSIELIQWIEIPLEEKENLFIQIKLDRNSTLKKMIDVVHLFNLL